MPACTTFTEDLKLLKQGAALGAPCSLRAANITGQEACAQIPSNHHRAQRGFDGHAGHGLSYADIYKRSLICHVEQPTCLLQVMPAQ